jgi:PKD repeat protein
VAQRPSTTIARGGTYDFDGDATADLQVLQATSECGGYLNKFSTINGSQRAFAGDYRTQTLSEAQAATYGSGLFCGTAGDVTASVFIKTSQNSLVKFWPADVYASSAGARIEWELLSSGLPPAPTADYTFTTYDLIAFFTDTSTGSPTGWSWSFGDSGSSTAQSPSHKYASAGSRNVQLTASNIGGSTNVTKSVSVSPRPSTTIARGASYDFDGDGVNDIQVLQATSECGGYLNKFSTVNGSQRAFGGDYRTQTISHAQSASYGTGLFCGSAGDVTETVFIKTSQSSLVKFWPADVYADASGVRLEWELLFNGLPPAPTPNFTYSTYDVVVFFTDTTTGGASSWSWDFGDAQTSTQQNPRHTYPTAGTRTVTLSATNLGGTNSISLPVTVAERPSTTVATGGEIDLEGDGTNDLRVEPAALECGGDPNQLRTINGADRAVGGDYRLANYTAAVSLSYFNGLFCAASGDVSQSFYARTTSGPLVKFWVAQSAAGTGMRIESQKLAPTPTPLDATLDGRSDILCQRGSTGAIDVLRSLGTSFGSEQWSDGFVLHRYDTWLADVDGDGRSDLVSRNRDTGDVQVFRSNGSSFAYTAGSGSGGTWATGWSTDYDLYFADVAGDSRADLVGRNRDTGDVYVFVATSSNFSASSPGGLWSYGFGTTYDLYFADLTGDGKADLIARSVAGASPGDVHVAPSVGNAFAYSGIWTYGFSSGYDLIFADVTGDRVAELVARYYGAGSISGDVYVMHSNGSSSFVWNGVTTPWTYGWGSSYEIFVRDVDGDGLADLIGRNSSSGELYVARAVGTSFVFQGEWMTGIASTSRLK